MRQKFKLLPLQIILAVLPLVLYLRIANSGFGAYPWNSSDDTYLDIFLHGKMVIFLILSVVLFCLTVYRIVKMDKQERKQKLFCFIPLLIYLFFVLLSTVCSENIWYSVFGSMDAKEPATVLLGYVTVALYTYLVVESAEDMEKLVTVAVAGSVCMAVLGLFQAIGKDPLLLEGIQVLFAGRRFIDTYGLLKLTFPEGMAYGTLFNPNYVGTYVAMYLPLAAVGLAMYRSVWKKVICGCTCLGLLVMLFASQSRTGLIAVVAVAVVFVVFFGQRLRKRWYFIVPGVLLAVAAFLLVDSQRDFLLINRLGEMFKIRQSEEPVSGVDTTGNGVRVLYKDTEFTVRMNVEENRFFYEVTEGNEQKDISYTEDKSYAHATLSTGDEIAIQTAKYQNYFAFGLVINDRSFYFTNQMVAGNYMYINGYGRLDECVIPANVFPGYEATASGRGYVWGRTIPLLLSHLVIGSGPDTFAVVFPQNDYVARYQSGFDETIFTRPHSFYLQMGVQTGVLSLVAFLVFYAVYFIKSCVRYCFRDLRKTEERLGFALFLCTVGFMAAGLANDSLIVVSPTFYLLLGAGMAVNDRLCPRREKNKTEEGK